MERRVVRKACGRATKTAGSQRDRVASDGRGNCNSQDRSNRPGVHFIRILESKNRNSRTKEGVRCQNIVFGMHPIH